MQIARRITRRFNLRMVQARPFSETGDTPPEPVQRFDYQAPKDDTYQDFESTRNFIRRYFLLFPIALYCGYHMLFQRQNEFSKEKEIKLGSGYFENHVVGPLLTRRLMKHFDGKVYKQDTEEVKMVRDVLAKVVEANALEKNVNMEKLQIKIVHSDILGLFFNLDHTLIISSKCLKLAEDSPEQLGLLLTHELAHFLLQHQGSRMLYAYFLEWFDIYDHVKRQFNYDPLKKEFLQRTYGQRFCCFYPKQRLVDKFYEKKTDAFAIHLWRQCFEPSNSQEQLEGHVRSLYSEKLELMLSSIPVVDFQQEKMEARHKLFEYKRGPMVMKMVRNKVES